MRFKGLDLNLLVALDVLLEERSVARSAERLNLSQPAMSAALSRLRTYFNDPILAQHGKRMIPTAQALAMRSLLSELLGGIDSLIMRSTSFDPVTSDRWFKIGASDFLYTTVFSQLMPELQKLAPGIRIDLQPPTDATFTLLEQGDLDLVITPEDYCLKDHPSELLFEENIVVVGDAKNPLMSVQISEEQFYSAGHVAVAIGRMNGTSFAENYLKARGRERHVEVVTATFSIVPDLVVGTNRIAVMHERLARMLGQRMPIKWSPLPFAFPVMREMMQYHRTRMADPGLQWLIAQIRKTVEVIDP